MSVDGGMAAVNTPVQTQSAPTGAPVSPAMHSPSTDTHAKVNDLLTSLV